MQLLRVPVSEINAKVPPSKVEGGIKVGFVLLKGASALHAAGDEICLAFQPEDGNCETTFATVYDVKHVTIADLSKYHRLLHYFADASLNRFMALRTWLQREYPGIIDGEIVTMVFYALPAEDETE